MCTDFGNLFVDIVHANKLPSHFQRISYSKMDSDLIARMKGTYVERPKKKRPVPMEEEAPDKKKKNKRYEPWAR
jgi:hypothetical protein